MVHRIRLTREGIYYLFVLLFVMGGAVFREVNLLLVISAIMIGPIVFSWRLVSASLKRLEFRRDVPRTIAAGQSLSVSLQVVNRRWRLPTWGLHLHDTIQSTSPALPTTISTARTLIHCIPAQGSGSAEYQVRPLRRGRLRFTSLNASTQYPWGFVNGRVAVPLTDEVLVTPRIGKLTSRWRQAIGTASATHRPTERRRWSGQRRSLSDGDYYGLRQWRAGDSSRWIHWRTSAKIGGLAVLQFEQRPQHDVDLLLDLWLPNDPQPNQQISLERAIQFAATAIADLGRRSIGKLHVTIAGLDERSWERPATQWFATELLEYLAEVPGGTGISTARLESRTATARATSRIIVISTRPRSQIGHPGIAASSEWIDASSRQLNDYFEGMETP